MEAEGSEDRESRKRVEDDGGSRGRSRGERRRRYGEGRGTRGETHKAAYVSSVMRTGDFSFRARECKRKMKARSFFSPGGRGGGGGRRRCMGATAVVAAGAVVTAVCVPEILLRF